MSSPLITEVEWQYAMLVLGWVTELQCTAHLSDGFATLFSPVSFNFRETAVLSKVTNS